MTPATDTATILIVDDMPSNLGVVVDLLEARGYRVAIAQDGEEGLQRAQLVQPDLILLDVMLPGADGFEICRRLKADEKMRDIPVVFMTALASTEHKVKGFAAGGVDYLTKPLQVDEVLARVGTHLKLHATQRRLEAQNAELLVYRGHLEKLVAARTAELRATNEHLKLKDFALNRVREAAYLIDENARFLYVNDESCRALGYSAEELLTMTVMDIGPGVTAEIWNQLWQDLRQNVSLSIEATHRRKDGSVFPVEISASYFEYDGKAYDLALVRDVTERKRTERELLLLNLAVNTTTEAAFLHDRQGRFVYVNDAACRSLGYGREELLTMSPLDIDPDLTPSVFEHLQRSAFEIGPASNAMESRHRTHGSRIFPVEINSSVIDYGGAKYCLTLVRDITERKEAERKLQASEAQFRTLAENAPDNIIRYDRQCRMIYVNPLLAATMRPSAGELLGKTSLEAYPDGRYADYHAKVAGVIASGAPDEIEIEVPGVDGAVRFHQVRFVAERDAAGEIVGALAIGRDITERKEVERKLHASEQMFRALAENAPDPIIRYDRACRRFYVNPAACAIYGCAADDLLGKIPEDLLRLPEGSRFVDAVRRVLATGEAGALDFLYRNGQGEIRWGHSRLAPEFDTDGNVVSVLSVARDIHDIKESERRYRTLAENSPDNIARYDSQCRMVYINPQLEATTGMPAAELLGRTPAQAHPGVDMSRYMACLADVLRRGCESEYEAVLPDLGAGPRHHHIRIVAERNEAGQIVGALALGRDITERQQTENTLRFIAQRGWSESTETFLSGLARHLGETLGVDYVVIDRLAEPGIAETVALYAKGDIVPNMRYVLQDTPCDNVMGKTLCCYAQGVQARFPADALLAQMGVDSYVGIPLWDSSGQAIGLIALMDGKPLRNEPAVTNLLQIVATRAAAELERERADTLLRASERKFRTLAENLPDNIVRYDRDGRAVYINPALEKTLGAAAAAAKIGATVREYYADGSFEDYAACIDAVLAGGKAAEIEKILPLQPPQLHLIDMVPERNQDGEVVGVLAIGHDITERKRMEVELRRQAEFQRSLLDGFNDVGMQLMIVENGRVVYYSNRKRALDFGLTDAEIDAHPVMLDHIHPDDRARVADLHRRRLAGEAVPSTYELGLMTPDGRRADFEISVAVIPETHPVRTIVIAKDIGERKRAEVERRAHLHYFESMDRINRAIQQASDPEQMMSDVLDVVRTIFDCDRAFLMYPCDPEATTWSVPKESDRPEYPGVLAQGLVMPMDPDVAATLRLLLDADGPVQFGPGTAHPLPAGVSEQFGFKCFMSMAVRPRVGKPWQFGIHQCSYARVWTADEKQLMQKIGWRLADGLTSLLAHRQVRDREAHLRTLVQTIPDLVWAKDMEGVYLNCNPRFERFFGATEAEIVGKTDYDFVDRELADFFRAHDRRAMAAGKPTSNEEWLSFAADGYRGLFETVKTPLRDAAGKIVGVLGVARDITGRKAMEAALLASEQEFRSLAENSPDIIVRHDRDCRCTYVNPAYERETEIPEGTLLNVAPDDRWCIHIPTAEYLARLRQVMETGAPGEIVLSWPRLTDGAVVQHALIIVAERGADGQVKGALSIGRNITALVEAERRLEESRAQLRDLATRREAAREEERRRIARELHDELGQQLTALRFNVTLLDFQFGEDRPRVRETTAELLHAVDRAIQTTRDVSSSLRPAVLDMGIVPALEWLVAEFSRHSGIAFDLKLPQSEMRMDEERAIVVFRIVQESLTNATRHSRADQVQVVLGYGPEGYVVEIRDNGVGFDPDGPRQQKSMGLVGIRERALALGGEVVVSSALGWGTVVRTRIPAAKNEEGES